MANPEHLQILQQRVGAWNAWRHENRDITPDLSGADLSGADLSRADLKTARLTRAQLGGARLTEADLTEADLTRANLSGARLTRTNLTRANLSRADLSRAHLSRADLSRADLSGADLKTARLTWAQLGGADLTEADLTEADLTRANLSGARLTRTNLTRANLSGANLGRANLSRANLTEADLSNASLIETIFSNVNLTAARGLETCHHSGPSTLDHRTLAKSGPLPLAFLRGCGLPDVLIDYLPSLLNEPFQFYSCFISYASRDQAFAERLHADLQNKGVRCWFAPKDLPIGARTLVSIDESIRLYDKLLLILSKSSVKSQWVEGEVATALARERQQDTTILFPVRIDDTVMTLETGWPALIRNTRNIGDFQGWETHDVYQKAFDRLLRDLTNAARQPATPA